MIYLIFVYLSVIDGYAISFKFIYGDIKTYSDTLKKDTMSVTPKKDIQKGIKFYLGANTGLEVLHFRDLYELAQNQYPNEYKNGNTFTNLRNKHNFYYYFWHANLNIDIQLRWFVLRKSYFGILYNFSHSNITLSKGYVSSSFYSFMWLGYSNKYKNKSYYFTILKGSPLLWVISLGITYSIFPDLVNGKNVHGEDEVKSYPMNVKVSGTTGLDAVEAEYFNIYLLKLLYSNFYFDFGKRINKKWYVGGYFYFQGLSPFNTTRPISGHVPPSKMKSYGVTRYVGIHCYYLLNRK